MARTTTLSTLAQALGVSRTTVSNAYSRPEKLSAELRERIFAAARERGYEGPSALAASLRTGRTDTVGVLFTDDLEYAFADPVSALFLAGVAGAAVEAGHALTIVSAPRGAGRSALSKAVLDGLIVYSVDDNSPALEVARSRGFPTVSVDQRPQPGTPAVNITDRAGAAAAVAHLAERGHTSLAAVTVAAGPARRTCCGLVAATARSHNHVVRERMAGWRSGCAAAGIAPPLTVSCPVNLREHGRHAARLLLDHPAPPTGIVCLSDELAMGVMAELAARAVRVPDDVSVVGYDDSPLAAMAIPPLTTVRQPARDKGAAAARLLLDRLRGTPPAAPIVLATEFVVRRSTADPR
jgi:DNA-binding LacI/PurR family transcriptional regulator